MFISFGLGILFGCAIMLCGGTDNFINSFSIYEERKPLEVILEFVERLEEKKVPLYCRCNTMCLGVRFQDIRKIVKEMREENGW